MLTHGGDGRPAGVLMEVGLSQGHQRGRPCAAGLLALLPTFNCLNIVTFSGGGEEEVER